MRDEDEGEGEGEDEGESGKRRIRELRPRIDGFTPERQRKFLKTLRRTGCVADSARAAGVSTTTVDRARRNFADFDSKCRAARELAVPNLEAIAYQRATVGAPAKIVRKGRLFEVRVKPSDALLRLLLTGAAPKRYGRYAGLPAAKVTEEDKCPTLPTAEQTRARIVAKVAAIKRHKVRYEGYSLGPNGELVPPGWQMVGEEELKRLGWSAPERGEAEAAAAEGGEGGS